MDKRNSGSTRHLLQLCGGYFLAYVLTGILVKYFTALRTPKLTDIDYLANNTIGGSLFALAIVFALGWLRLKSNRLVQWGPLKFPSEVYYILPSGICTAVVIPTTTLMYTLPISVMVAMVIMRGSVIVISRAVDAIQIRQGILKKKVFKEENLAVLFALLAVGTNVFWTPSFKNSLADFLLRLGVQGAASLHTVIEPGKGGFEFFHSLDAMVIMGLYIGAYSIRIYIMNFYKNTRGKGVELDNEGFFAIEQIFACLAMIALGVFFFTSPSTLGWTDNRLAEFQRSIQHPHLMPVLSGIPFGAVAFFSVFIFMFKGRTATFAGLVNRLTSLLAGTASTLILCVIFHTKPPTAQDWVSVVFILVAVFFLSRAEKLRAAELARGSEGEVREVAAAAQPRRTGG